MFSLFKYFLFFIHCIPVSDCLSHASVHVSFSASLFSWSLTLLVSWSHEHGSWHTTTSYIPVISAVTVQCSAWSSSDAWLLYTRDAHISNPTISIWPDVCSSAAKCVSDQIKCRILLCFSSLRERERQLAVIISCKSGQWLQWADGKTMSALFAFEMLSISTVGIFYCRLVDYWQFIVQTFMTVEPACIYSLFFPANHRANKLWADIIIT